MTYPLGTETPVVIDNSIMSKQYRQEVALELLVWFADVCDHYNDPKTKPLPAAFAFEMKPEPHRLGVTRQKQIKWNFKLHCQNACLVTVHKVVSVVITNLMGYTATNKLLKEIRAANKLPQLKQKDLFGERT